MVYLLYIHSFFPMDLLKTSTTCGHQSLIIKPMVLHSVDGSIKQIQLYEILSIVKSVNRGSKILKILKTLKNWQPIKHSRRNGVMSSMRLRKILLKKSKNGMGFVLIPIRCLMSRLNVSTNINDSF